MASITMGTGLCKEQFTGYSECLCHKAVWASEWSVCCCTFSKDGKVIAPQEIWETSDTAINTRLWISDTIQPKDFTLTEGQAFGR